MYDLRLLAAAYAGSFKVSRADGAQDFIAGLQYIEQVCLFALYERYGGFAVRQGGAESRGGESLHDGTGAVDVLGGV